MDETKCKEIGKLQGGKWDKMHDMSRRVYGTDGISPTLHTCGDGNLEPKIIEPIALDEQNGYLRQDGCVGTLTTNGSSPKHNNRIVEPDSYRFYRQAIETLHENDCKEGDTIDAYNKRVSKDGVSPAITTRPDGFKTAILPVVADSKKVTDIQKPSYRIRKLTPSECFRLMGVKKEDYERIASNHSVSSQYHLAGDSIVTTCLMAIFGELLSVDYAKVIDKLTADLIDRDEINPILEIKEQNNEQ